MGGVRLTRLTATAKRLEERLAAEAHHEDLKRQLAADSTAQELRAAREVLGLPRSPDWPSRVLAVVRDLNRRRPLGEESLPDLLRRLDAAREALKWPKRPGWAQRVYRIVAPLDELLADPERERCEAKIQKAGRSGATSRSMAVVAMVWWTRASADQADHLLRLALVFAERANRLEKRGKP